MAEAVPFVQILPPCLLTSSSRLLLVREAAHSSREQHKFCLLGAACTHQLYPGRGPGERPGFVLRERSQNRERVRTTATGEAAEIFVTLPDRHGHHIRGDSGGKNCRGTDASLR